MTPSKMVDSDGSMRVLEDVRMRCMDGCKLRLLWPPFEGTGVSVGYISHRPF